MPVLEALDQRDLITKIRSGDQLPFDDAAQVLQDALATQDHRRDWILTHWPHIVEYAEITATISVQTEVEPKPALDVLDGL